MNKIQQYLLDHQDEMIALTKQLVNIDSPSYHLAGIQQIMRILESRMNALGMTTYQLESEKPGTVLVGQLAGKESGAPVILSGHIDTVFPVGTAQQRPFKIAGDKMTGPGIFDMKPGIVIGLYAIQAQTL
ncbi:M20/M25/M40 family metallo-hydrolase [Limosilactobacillus agrestis]|uniref:M20/M25/M40 family metallo-hydrolase n=1 Tax=Limosilactobacillus agrestis TaxID=2759748 RepID=UPI002279CFFB|nr:M20/M25/M40 family metallo-hydrolase [Limosilactobacillus agrestis]